jgi:hypothetical protein
MMMPMIAPAPNLTETDVVPLGSEPPPGPGCGGSGCGGSGCGGPGCGGVYDGVYKLFKAVGVWWIHIGSPDGVVAVPIQFGWYGLGYIFCFDVVVHWQLMSPTSGGLHAFVVSHTP